MTRLREPDVLVDVGIPTHGRPAHLSEAIESVLGQTIVSWRLTVSENGPRSDYVAGILEPYLVDPRIRYVATGQDLGAARNSTRLIQTGSAPYVGVLHDDDRWGPGFLRQRVEFLDKHHSCGFVFSACDFIDEQGSVISRFDPGLPEGVQERRRFLRQLYHRNLVSVCSVLVRRSAYETVGAAFNEAILFFDHEMWLRLASSFEAGFLPSSDAAYRVHSAQTTTRVSPRWWEHHVHLLEEVEPSVSEEIPPRDRRRARFATLGRGSVEALRRGDRRAATVLGSRALRAHPAAPVDPVIVWRGLRRLTQGRLRPAGRDESEAAARASAGPVEATAEPTGEPGLNGGHDPTSGLVGERESVNDRG